MAVRALTGTVMVVIGLAAAYFLLYAIGGILGWGERREVTPVVKPPMEQRTPTPWSSPSPTPTSEPRVFTPTPSSTSTPPPPTPIPVVLNLPGAELQARLDKLLSQVNLPQAGTQMEVKVMEDHLLLSGRGQMGQTPVSSEGVEVWVEGMRASASGVIKVGAVKMRASGEAALRVDKGKLKVDILSVKVGNFLVSIPKEELNQQANRFLEGLDLGLPHNVDRVRIERGALIVEGSNPP